LLEFLADGVRQLKALMFRVPSKMPPLPPQPKLPNRFKRVLEYFEKGQKYERNKKFRAAYHCYMTVVRFDPLYFPAFCNLGSTLTRLGEFQLAIEHLRKAIKMAPNHAQSYSNLGQVLLEKGDYSDAIAVNKVACEKCPCASTYYRLGCSYAGSGQIDEALLSFLKAIKEDPLQARTYSNVEVVLMLCRST
jgi:protein O-GlcNAc transferase